MKKTTKSTMENLALLSQVGIMMIVPIFGGVLIGKYLDGRFGTGHVLLIVGVLLGVGASFRNLFQLATTKSKEYQNDYTASSEANAFSKAAEKEKNNRNRDEDKTS